MLSTADPEAHRPGRPSDVVDENGKLVLQLLQPNEASLIFITVWRTDAATLLKDKKKVLKTLTCNSNGKW